MNNNTILFFDIESSSANAYKTQPLSIAAVAINPRTLTWDKNDQFYSVIRPLSDDEAISKGLDTVQEGALKVNKLTREELAEAPVLPVVWEKFCGFINRYKSGSSQWNRPIAAGFNITNFDIPIINRLCAGPEYGFGPKDKDGRPSLFHPRDIWDLQKVLGMIVENFPDFNSQSMDTYRQFFGFSKNEMSHNSLVDSLEGSALLVKLIQHLRQIYSPQKLMGSMASFKVEEYL